MDRDFIRPTTHFRQPPLPPDPQFRGGPLLKKELRTKQTEATEVALAAAALNRMLGFGNPNYVRIA